MTRRANKVFPESAIGASAFAHEIAAGYMRPIRRLDLPMFVHSHIAEARQLFEWGIAGLDEIQQSNSKHDQARVKAANSLIYTLGGLATRISPHQVDLKDYYRSAAYRRTRGHQ